MDNITLINGNYSFICEKIAQLEGFESPSIRDVFIDPPEREGSLFIDEIAGLREFSWRGLITDDIQVNRRLLARVCQPGGLKTIKFTTCDGIAVQIDATLKLTSAYVEYRSPYMISAKAPNPYFLSQDLHVSSTPITVRRGGMPIPAGIPGPIGAGGGTPFTIVNAGDTISRPIFEIKGPGSNFLIRNITTGQSMRLVTSLAASEVVIIDTQTNDVTKGVQSLYGVVTRDPVGSWPILQGGDNQFVFSAISGTNTTTLLTVKWRDAYSGF